MVGGVVLFWSLLEARIEESEAVNFLTSSSDRFGKVCLIFSLIWLWKSSVGDEDVVVEEEFWDWETFCGLFWLDIDDCSSLLNCCWVGMKEFGFGVLFVSDASDAWFEGDDCDLDNPVWKLKNFC